MSEPTSRDLIERFIDEIWNQSKYELLDELAALPTPASPALFAYRGPDGLRQLIEGYYQAFPKSTLTINHFIGQGERVAVRAKP